MSRRRKTLTPHTPLARPVRKSRSIRLSRPISIPNRCRGARGRIWFPSLPFRRRFAANTTKALENVHAELREIIAPHISSRNIIAKLRTYLTLAMNQFAILYSDRSRRSGGRTEGVQHGMATRHTNRVPSSATRVNCFDGRHETSSGYRLASFRYV